MVEGPLIISSESSSIFFGVTSDTDCRFIMDRCWTVSDHTSIKSAIFNKGGPLGYYSFWGFEGTIQLNCLSTIPT